MEKKLFSKTRPRDEAKGKFVDEDGADPGDADGADVVRALPLTFIGYYDRKDDDFVGARMNIGAGAFSAQQFVKDLNSVIAASAPAGAPRPGSPANAPQEPPPDADEQAPTPRPPRLLVWDWSNRPDVRSQRSVQSPATGPASGDRASRRGRESAMCASCWSPCLSRKYPASLSCNWRSFFRLARESCSTRLRLSWCRWAGPW